MPYGGFWAEVKMGRRLSRLGEGAVIIIGEVMTRMAD